MSAPESSQAFGRRGGSTQPLSARSSSPIPDSPAGRRLPLNSGTTFTSVVKFAAAALVFCLLAVLLVVWLSQLPRMGRYPLQDHDHDEIMTSSTPSPSRTITILFVGNSLTFVHDVPAMLVNIASSDRANTTRLAVKADTYPNGDLHLLLAKTAALAWVQAHHPDVVVLQEHDLWYEPQGNLDFAVKNASEWSDALKPLGVTPVLFEVWADGDGSDAYTSQDYAAFGLSPDKDAQNAAESTDRIAQQFGFAEARVGEAFERARQTKGAPDVYGPDHHHASVAGAYLAALVFYQHFTGRSGQEAAYRPWGLSAGDAAKLVQVSEATGH